MQKSISCLTADRLCIEYNEVEVNKPFEVYWPVGLVPEISDMTKLRIFIYQSDLLRNPQPDACNVVGLNALYSWTPLVISDGTSGFPLLRSTSISIPTSSELLSAISSDNHFFLQIKSIDNQLCSIGPYSIPSPFTSFKIKFPSNGNDVSNSSGTNIPEVPNNTNSDPSAASSSLIDRKDLQIGFGVGLGILAILIIIVAWILRRKVKANEQKLKSQQFKDDISKLSITFGNEFLISNDDLIPKELIKSPQDRHQIVVMENIADKHEIGSTADII